MAKTSRKITFKYGTPNNGITESAYSDIIFDPKNEAIYARGHKFQCKLGDTETTLNWIETR